MKQFAEKYPGFLIASLLLNAGLDNNSYGESIKVGAEKFNTIQEFREYISTAKVIRDKNELIVANCQGKDVLDIGCIDHSYKTALELGDNWLHKQIMQKANTLMGLDLLADDAKELKKHGYNIIAGNAQSFNLERQFDVLVAGDLIEHLSNIGSFLECVKAHMHATSSFMLTTPNPFNIEQIWQAIFNKAIVVNSQHTVWIDPIVAWQLLTRHGLTIVDFYWVDTRFSNKIWSTPWRHIANKITDITISRVPLLRPDFAIVATL